MVREVLVAVAEASEEIEVVAPVDILRRAGASVTLASVDGPIVTLSRGISVVADLTIDECRGKPYDLIMLPGGMPGAEHLRDCIPLIELLKAQQHAGRYFAAICASPSVVLAHHGLLAGYSATGYPSMPLPSPAAAEFDVVVDRQCITSRGPGTALSFGLKLVEVLYGPDRAQQIAQAMLIT